MTRKKVIVLGATGTLGANITVYLKDIGYDVVAVGRRKSDNGFFADKNIEYISADITSKKDLDR